MAPTHILDWLATLISLTDKVKVKVILWLTVSQPVYLCVNHQSGSQDQIFITVRQLQVCWCGVPSLTRGQVCCLQLLLVLANAVILSSKSHGYHDQILLSEIRDSPDLESLVPMLYPPGTGWPSYTPRHWVLFSLPPTTCKTVVEVFEPASR
jgi:hypothetical protein